MLRMEYVPPSLDDLIHRTQHLIEKYTRGNPERIRLIHILETLLTFLNHLQTVKNDQNTEVRQYTTAELNEIAVGGYIFCTLLIGKDSHSTLYDILLETLEMDDSKNLGWQGTLIHLEKFYTFLNQTHPWVDEQKLSFADYLSDNELDIARLKQETDSVVSRALNELHPHILSLSKVMRPTHTLLAKEISNLHDAYLKAKEDQETARTQSCFGWFFPEIKPNAERLFVIQLGAIGSDLLPYIYKNIKDADKNDAEILNLHQRIMMGYLLFIIHLINQSYLTQWWNYSKLLELAYNTLHILNIDDPHSYMDKVTQEICMTAFESFINRDDVKAEIESRGEKYGELNQLQYIHPKIRRVTQELKWMNDSLQKENDFNGTSQYPAAMKLSTLMSFIADPLCPITAGGGAFLGYMTSKTIEATSVTSFLSNSLNMAGKLLPGTSGTVLQLVGIPFAANFMVEAGSIVGFAFMTHYIFKAALYLTGGALGAILIDVPAHKVEQCYHLLKQIFSKHDVMEAEYCFIESLRRFPKERYSDATDWQRIQLIPMETLLELRAGLNEDRASIWRSEGDLDADFDLNDDASKDENDELASSLSHAGMGL